MQKIHRWVLAAIAAPTLLFTAACTSSTSSVKKLDESSAAGLIETRLKAEPYKVRLGSISGLFGRTLIDYKNSQSQGDLETTFKRLLDKGLVQQTVETVSYPAVAGTFVTEDQWVKGVGQGSAEYVLGMSPNSNILTGEFRINTTANVIGQPERSTHNVQGAIQPDGKIALRFEDDGTGFSERKGDYVEKGSTAYLHIFPVAGGTYTDWQGQATGRRVEVKWYTYSWSSSASKDMGGDQSGPFFIGGALKVEDVTGLRLVKETEATAKFSWQASLNDMGRLFYPNQLPNGVGEASFGKKPDDTWFVDELRLNDAGSMSSTSSGRTIQGAAAPAAMRAANQACAVGVLRTLNTAEITYASTYSSGYSSDLSSLDGSNFGSPTASRAGLIDSQIASGLKCSYRFTYIANPSRGRNESYKLYADPIEPGMKHYYTDQTGVIRQNLYQRGGPNDPAIPG
jgi:type IV pilus assembly protein PilA